MNMTEFTLLSIPEVALEKILSYLSYDEIATNRLVCKQFNIICGGLLTKGFIHLEKKHVHIQKLVKGLLPRRPSERRNNIVVSRYCEILHAMESRIHMLNMIYMRYIEKHMICFVPGKVLDEIQRLLNLVEARFEPPQNINQLMEELRDLSSMAMEHFDEYIKPNLDKQEEERQRPVQYNVVVPKVMKPHEDEKLQKELKKIHRRSRVFKSQITYLLAKTRRMCEKINRQTIRARKQNSVIKEQKSKIQVQASRIENHEMTIVEMKKKFSEMQNNFLEMKSKWEMDNSQSATSPSISHPNPVRDETEQYEEQSTMSKNFKKMVQFETIRPRSNIKKRLGSRIISENRQVMIKPRTPKLKTEESKRRRYRSMVDIDIWRHKCPTSRLSYSLWNRNYLKSKTNKPELQIDRLQNLTNPQPSTSQNEKNSRKNSEFVYKSIIKQRASRVFPLTRLDLERKRKSYTCSDIPTKFSRNEANSALKTFGLIDELLVDRKDSERCRDGSNKTPNILTISEANRTSLKRKRESEDIL